MVGRVGGVVGDTTRTTLEVALATPEDLPALLRGGRELLQLLPWVPPLDLITPLRLVYRYLYDPKWVLFVCQDVWVDREGGIEGGIEWGDPPYTIVGFLLANLVHHPLLPHIENVQEWALWVHPSYRRGKATKLLHKAMKEWGRFMGAYGYIRISMKATPSGVYERVVFRPFHPSHSSTQGSGVAGRDIEVEKTHTI